MTSEFGELLQHARAYKGVSLREAERATRISRNHLAALEREEFSELPPLTYARGIVRNYAEYLGLDPVQVLARFEDIHGQRSGGFRVVPAVKPLDVPSHWVPNFAIIAFMVVMSAVIFAWMYSAYFAPDETSLTPTAQTAGSAGSLSSLPAGPTPTPRSALGGGEASPVPSPTTAATEPSPTETTIPTATASGSHTFVLTTTERVWVQATIDGETVLSETVAAGQSRSFEGDELHVVSGNAAYVRVSVDGVDQGVLGDSWDAERTFPAE